MPKILLNPVTRSAIRWADTGKLLTSTDIIRVSFADMVMAPTYGVCFDNGSACGSGFRYSWVDAGDSLNNYTRDMVFTSCSTPERLFQHQTAAHAGPEVQWANLCFGSPGAGGLMDYRFSFITSGVNAGKINMLVRGASDARIMFDGLLDPCDLANGVEVENNIAALGCYTRLIGGSALTASYGGRAILSNVCP